MQTTGYVALLTSIALDLLVHSLMTAKCILDAGVFTAWIMFLDEFTRHSIRSGIPWVFHTSSLLGSGCGVGRYIGISFRLLGEEHRRIF